MITGISDIAAADWSIKLETPGSVVEGLDDINQCLRIILQTPKGSRPHEPLFGCDAWKYLDAPMGEAIPRIIIEVYDAIEMWEPRAHLISVTPDMTEAATGRLTLRLSWKIRGDDATWNSTVML